jgi:hypothetical protein
MSSAKFQLNKFLKFYKKFNFHPTWTKDKHKEYSILRLYLEGIISKVEISSNRDSKTTKVHLANSFTIFKVPIDQLGKMKEFRNQWVLMYCYYRYKFNYKLWVFPLEKGISRTISKSLKDLFEDYYIDNIQKEIEIITNKRLRIKVEKSIAINLESTVEEVISTPTKHILL